MRYKKIFLLGGTTEGRQIGEFLKKQEVKVWVSVATDYGKELLDAQKLENTDIKVIQSRLQEQEMIDLLKRENFDLVIDATHPYAQMVTHNIKEACAITQTAYKRIIRKSYKEEGIRHFETIEAIVAFLNHTEGNVLLTTGSKDLPAFTHVKAFEQRLYVRMLPVAKTIEECLKIGFKMSHLICMQGPFSKAMNRAMLGHIQAKYMVTKDSGEIGGYKEKVDAAKAMKVELLLLDRPEEERGIGVEEVCELLRLS